MWDKFYVVMAYDAGLFGQSDYLYLLEWKDGRIFGYSTEFEVATFDIEKACSSEDYHQANWFGCPDYVDWTPASLEEIKASRLGKHLIGSKKDMKIATPLDPIE